MGPVPYTWSIDRAARFVLVQGAGPMDLEESLAAPVALAGDPEFDPEFGVLVDLREIEYEPWAGDVVEIGRNLVRLRGLFPRGIAVVVPHRLTLAAELGAAIAAAGGVSVQVFEDLEAARTWVDAAGDPQRGAA
jgi:hypothetical protein